MAINNERRVRFRKGKQREFLQLVLTSLNCPSLRALNQYGFSIPYSTLKNYHTETRLMPEGLFRNLCLIAKLDSERFGVEFLDANWGQNKSRNRNVR